MMKKCLVVVLLVTCVQGRAGIFKNLSASLNLKGQKYLKEANQLFEQEQYAQAVTFFEKYRAKNKGKQLSPKTLYRMAVCYMELGTPDRGFRYIEEAYSRQPKDLDTAVLYAEYQVAMGNPDGGVQVYKAVIEDHPNDYLSYIRLGELLVGQGALKEARAAWHQAAVLDPSKPEAWARLSESYLKVEKNPLEAYFYARKLLDVVGPDEKPAIEQMLKKIAGDLRDDYENYYRTQDCLQQARAAYKKADFQKSYETLHACRNIPDLPGEFYLLLGEVCDKLGKFQDAAYAYERCVALGIENGDVTYSLGLSYLNAGNKQKAIVAFRRALQYDDVRDKAQEMLGKISAK